jgi:hypothetical protein
MSQLSRSRRSSRPKRPNSIHLVVKWNAKESFEPGTIPAHAKVLSADPSPESFVWWGKISKTGRRGITGSDIKILQQQINRGVETHLYLYCPDSPSPTLHVGRLSWVQNQRPKEQERIPTYYSKLAYRIPFWFKLTDIRLLSKEHLENLALRSGDRYDEVATNFYPLVVNERNSLSLFDYTETRGKKWHELQQLDQPRRAESSMDPKLVFVLMPFQRKFEDVWELGIKPSIKKLGLNCKRADDFWNAKEIMDIIRQNIRCARLIVADMTNNNPNVFYELGYAHALGKPVILITQERQKVPFDLRGIFNIEYSNVSDLTRRLPKMVKSVITR